MLRFSADMDIVTVPELVETAYYLIMEMLLKYFIDYANDGTKK